jgi:hypothetical protein
VFLFLFRSYLFFCLFCSFHLFYFLLYCRFVSFISLVSFVFLVSFCCFYLPKFFSFRLFLSNHLFFLFYSIFHLISFVFILFFCFWSSLVFFFVWFILLKNWQTAVNISLLYSTWTQNNSGRCEKVYNYRLHGIIKSKNWD